MSGISCLTTESGLQDCSPVLPIRQGSLSVVTEIFAAQTPQASLHASYANADRFVLLGGIQALRANGVLAQIKYPFTHKANRTRREPAMPALGAFFDRFLRSEVLSEVVFLLEQNLVPLVLDAMADKDAAVREAAKYALLTLVDILSPEALLVALLPILLNYIRKNTTKWQGVAEVFTLISRMARGAVIHASGRAQILRKYVESRLEDLIPLVADAVLDLNPEVMYLSFVPSNCWCR